VKLAQKAISQWRMKNPSQTRADCQIALAILNLQVNEKGQKVVLK
jgi:hypothetical protein